MPAAARRPVPFYDRPPPGRRWGLPWQGEPRTVRLPPLDRELMERVRPIALAAREAVRRMPLALWFNRRTMQGACACVSYVLTLALRRLGIAAEFVLRQHHAGGVDHAWVEVGELVIDATATQFGARSRVHFARTGSARPYLYMASHRNQRAIEAAGDRALTGILAHEFDRPAPSHAQLQRLAARVAEAFAE